MFHTFDSAHLPYSMVHLDRNLDQQHLYKHLKSEHKLFEDSIHIRQLPYALTSSTYHQEDAIATEEEKVETIHLKIPKERVSRKDKPLYFLSMKQTQMIDCVDFLGSLDYLEVCLNAV